jgi:hypothetical protein
LPGFLVVLVPDYPPTANLSLYRLLVVACALTFEDIDTTAFSFLLAAALQGFNRPPGVGHLGLYPDSEGTGEQTQQQKNPQPATIAGRAPVQAFKKEPVRPA